MVGATKEGYLKELERLSKRTLKPGVTGVNPSACEIKPGDLCITIDWETPRLCICLGVYRFNRVALYSINGGYTHFKYLHKVKRVDTTALQEWIEFGVEIKQQSDG